jgi:TAG lipase/steryl ester hydrolase/phospholipase A2/LPA acyltransferase
VVLVYNLPSSSPRLATARLATARLATPHLNPPHPATPHPAPSTFSNFLTPPYPPAGATQSHKVLIEALPAFEKALVQVIDVIFVPKALARQLVAAIILQTGVVTIESIVSTLRWFYGNLSVKSREVRQLRCEIDSCSNQSEWQVLAERIDSLTGDDNWRAKPSCELYERDRLVARIDEFHHLIRRGMMFDMMFTLRGGIGRSKYGLLHEGLFTKAKAGTKLLVEDYNSAICDGLDFVCEGDTSATEDVIANDTRLAFFNETRHGYGRTALLLSGGAALGFYHAGVVKALVENNLMPRVIGGASAGSILAAMIGTRTDDELLNGLFQVEGTPAVDDSGTVTGHSGTLQLDFFRPHGFSVGRDYSNYSGFSDDASAEPIVPTNFVTSQGLLADVKRAFLFITPRSFQWLTSSIYDVLTGNLRTSDMLMKDTNHFRRCVRVNAGNFTFQEAFDRTGRILNITVSPQNRSDPPRLLNYLTSPHVLVWSAAVASSAVPGLFEASKLMVKDADGTERFESTSGARFQDGSMENDLPMQQLSEMFNINHFIISQVNPHAYMLASFAGSKTIWQNPIVGFLNGLCTYLKQEVKGWIRNIVELAGGRRLAPLWELRRGFWTQLITQEYEGRETDITMYPWSKHRSVMSSFMHCIFNPSKQDFREWLVASERETWNHLPAIRSHCCVEMKLDKCVQKLRKRILMESMGRRGPESSGNNGDNSNSLGKRVPSFYTSPSLVNLSGLSVGDQTLLSVQQSQDTGRTLRKGGQPVHPPPLKQGESATDLLDGAAPNMDSGSEDERNSSGYYNPTPPSAGTYSPGARSVKSEGGGADDNYVKSTSMASFYYRKSKSSENLFTKKSSRESMGPAGGE